MDTILIQFNPNHTTNCIPKHHPVVFPLDSGNDDLCLLRCDSIPLNTWHPDGKQCLYFRQLVEEFFLDRWTLPLGPKTHGDTAVTFLENVGSHYQRQVRFQKTCQLKMWPQGPKLSLDLAYSVSTTIAKRDNEDPRKIRNETIVLSSYSGIMHRVSQLTK